ncbi:protein ref(2)P isoform X2 [Toxorhynchites rutilus septentrionalis]|uniref:protein ref(2)P isoform X2 n=1 Tax=Toxorhynchites rutilus septentrionalis TaxID=329112 RepID=UPI00247AA819|nr:protein ref(2)P isoform X2 [Toxorhynchites rutilus septentrionalis]
MVFPQALKITVHQKDGNPENFLMKVMKNQEVCYNFINLKNEVVTRYPELLQYSDIKFYWIDEEGDEIAIVNQADYMDCLDGLAGATVITRRIYVKGVTKEGQSNQCEPMEEASASKQDTSAPNVLPEDVSVHTNIVCDVCDDTIRGYRYKCMQCYNYDLCMRCEANFRHKDHLMLRIPSPDVYRRTPSRLFEKLRSKVADMSASNQDVDYENCKRSKRHHRRHSKDREDSKDRQEEKERKERKYRRECSAKASEQRRSTAGGRRCGTGFGHNFNFSHLINQVIDPANIHSAFMSSDAAAAAAAAAAESAQEAACAAMSNCPLFAAHPTSTASATATASASASASAPTDSEMNASAERPEEASASSSSNEPKPQVKPVSPASETRQLDFSWLAPTPESIQRINETFSKLLDPLGMNIEIRSNGSTPKPAQTQTPTEEKKDQTTETANTPTTSTPSQTTSVAGGTTSKSTEMDPIVELEKKLETTLLAEPLKKVERALEQSQDAMMSTSDDDSSSVSSVSLLSDNDENAAAAAESLEKRWTIVDLLDDDEEVVKEVSDQIESGMEEGGQNVTEATVSASTSKTSAAPATPASVPEVASASSANNVVTQIDYEQLGKALKQHLEAEKLGSQTPAAARATSPAATAPAPKESSPPRVVPTMAQPSTSSVSQATNSVLVTHSSSEFHL